MRMVVGITGSIASGKSTVSNYITNLGYPVVDCDEVSHDIILKGNLGYDAVLNCFGDDILDDEGNISRKKLGEIVFGNEQKLQTLNKIMHPLIYFEVKKMLDVNGLIFLDAPLLFESNFNDLCDEVIVVNVDLDKQIQRLLVRDSVQYDDALNKIKLQMSLDEKIKLATYVVDNNLDLTYLYKQIDLIMLKLGRK